MFDFVTDDIFRAGSGLSGGLGLTGDACGALTGTAMAIGARCGREFNDFKDLESKGKEKEKESEIMVRELIVKFKDKYGSIHCRDIQKYLTGRSFNFWNKKDLEEIRAACVGKEK